MSDNELTAPPNEINASKKTGWFKRSAVWLHENYKPLLIGIFLMFLAGWWNSRYPVLRYSVAIQKPSPTGEDGIFDVALANDGSRFVEEVECEVKFELCKIKKVEFDVSNLKAKAEISKDERKVDLFLPRLDSGEKIVATITATNPIQIPTFAIAVRGKDTKATRDDRPNSSHFDWGYMAVMSVLGLSFLFFVALQQARESTQKYMKEKDAEKIIRLLNGPAAGRFIVGREAHEIYWNSIRTGKIVLIEDVKYQIWLVENAGETIRVELFHVPGNDLDISVNQDLKTVQTPGT